MAGSTVRQDFYRSIHDTERLQRLIRKNGATFLLMPPPPPRHRQSKASQQMRETATFDQRETPALIRGGQSKPDSSANAPPMGPSEREAALAEAHRFIDTVAQPLGPSKREAALAGAHKSPTKFDGVVFKKTRATYIPPYPL